MSDLAQVTQLGRGGDGASPLIRLSYHQIGLFVAIVDAALIFCASVLADMGYGLWRGNGLDAQMGSGIGIVACAIFCLVAHSRDLYSLPTLLAAQPRISPVLAAWAMVLLVLPLVLFLLKVGSAFSRVSMIVFAFLGVIPLVGFRLIASRYLRRLMAKGWIAGRRAVIVGEADELGALNARSLLYRFGIEETARVPLRDVGEGTPSRDDIAKVDRAVDLARDTGATEIAVALNWSHTALLQIMRERLRRTPLPARLLPDHNIRSITGGRRLFSAALAIELQREPLTKIELAIKRSLDICLASAILLMLSPLLAIVSLAIKLDSPGPVIFSQRRNGFNGRQFTIYKFRTMNVLEDGPVMRQATKRDARVTSIGRVLRQSSVDELPQLFNVLKGDMSLVGPRPHAIAHDDEYKALIGNYAFRQHVKPGITGLAQVNGYRGATFHLDQMKKRVQFDLWYIDNWSLFLDLHILVRTTIVPLKRDAY
jgi:undecaprenyl-phosphate galactose phosphotransferase/putative colanic acid biosynthesis UDP-glucose lipid carrier transferase